MSVVQTVKSVDALWELRDVLVSEGPGLGLPLDLLEGLRITVGCDAVAFNAVDSRAKRHLFVQGADGDGTGQMRPGVLDEPRSFWEHYWSASCSWPDRVTDLSQVRLRSDFLSDREHRRSPVYREVESVGMHSMMAVWPHGGPGRTLRLLCVRDDGTDFTERDRFLLQLLRPHLYTAYRRSEVARDAALTGGVEALTERQRDVLTLVRQGATNYAIGRRLGISEGTVRTHLQNAYLLLGVSSRAAAAAALFEHESKANWMA